MGRLKWLFVRHLKRLWMKTSCNFSTDNDSCAQHYETIRERFQDYPINIGLLSRFRTRKQQNETIKGLKDGTVDIVIGTHRILSKDVTYKDLGLLIIDEEQRFGVTHKEKLNN